MKKLIILSVLAVLSSCTKDEVLQVSQNDHQLENRNSGTTAINEYNVGSWHNSTCKYVITKLNEFDSTSQIQYALDNDSFVYKTILDFMNSKNISIPNIDPLILNSSYNEDSLISSPSINMMNKRQLSFAFDLFNRISISSAKTKTETLDSLITVISSDNPSISKSATIATLEVLNSSLDLWAVQNYFDSIPSYSLLVIRDLPPNKKKVLARDAVITGAGFLLGGANPLSACVGLFCGAGASIGEVMNQKGYNTTYWPF